LFPLALNTRFAAISSPPLDPDILLQHC